MKNERDDVGQEDVKTPEETESAETSTATSVDVDKITQALEQKAKEAEEAHGRYLRTYADFENFRKRTQRDVADFKRYANEQMARELLTVVDNLALAVKHAEAGETQGLREGVELVYKQLLNVLEKFGITLFTSKGEPFDPGKHDAVMQQITGEFPENTVVQVFQEGYLYHEKVLRHAKVSVSKRPQEKGNGGETTEESNE